MCSLFLLLHKFVFKRTVHPGTKNNKNIPLRLFWCESASFVNVTFRDVCLLSNIMELGGTQLVAPEVPKTYIWWHLIPEIILSDIVMELF